MPATYRYDIPNRLVYSYGWGILTGEEMKAHTRHLPADPRFDPGYRQLQQYRDVAGMAVTLDELRHLAAHNPFGAGSRRAIVAPDKGQFGVARQYKVLRVGSRDELMVFYDTAAALAWLGLPPDWQPPPASPDDPVFEIPPGTKSP